MKWGKTRCHTCVLPHTCLVLSHDVGQDPLPHMCLAYSIVGRARVPITLAPLRSAVVRLPPQSKTRCAWCGSITNHNSDVIRSTMKEVGLFEQRDSLLIECLRLPVSRQGAGAIMQGFSFEWVAEKAAFRDAHGLTLLLNMLHTFADEDSFLLQKAIGYAISSCVLLCARSVTYMLDV